MRFQTPSSVWATGVPPSKPRKGSPDCPPTVTVEARVPPSALAPKVTSRTAPCHFSTGTSTAGVIAPS